MADDVLAAAIVRLTARYGTEVPAETIRRVLHDAYDELRGAATVTAFLPVLAERAAASRVAAIAAQVSDRGSGTSTQSVAPRQR